jgi:adenosylmethionine-8-amino-7-oxononanoate aminotransferase
VIEPPLPFGVLRPLWIEAFSPLTCRKARLCARPDFPSLPADFPFYCFTSGSTFQVRYRSPAGHPLAAAVGNATLDVMREEGLVERVRELEPVLEAAVHSLRSEPGVTDIRNIGLAAAVDLEPIPQHPGLRAMKVFEAGLRADQLFRYTGDSIAMGPPFISTPAELEHMIDTLRDCIRATR